MRTGISLYFASGYETNSKVIEKATAAGATFAFTSLQIPEETGVDYQSETRRLLALCREAGLSLIADISPTTLPKLGCSSIGELKKLGIDYVRLDFGFDAAQTVEMSHDFHVVFNASTISNDDIRAWRAAGADFSRFAACHNYYPKPLTGLSLVSVDRINRHLSDLGFTVMSFVPGDGTRRGPLHEGLPTVEEHRGAAGDGVALAMLDLYDASSDVVMVGDPDLAASTWERFSQLSNDRIVLHAAIEDGWESCVSGTHHDRPDSSDYVIRSQESRGYAAVGSCDFRAMAPAPRPLGSISVGNEGYLRYAGELEVARKDLPTEPRVNIIGQVVESDLAFLPHIRSGRGFAFELV